MVPAYVPVILFRLLLPLLAGIISFFPLWTSIACFTFLTLEKGVCVCEHMHTNIYVFTYVHTYVYTYMCMYMIVK